MVAGVVLIVIGHGTYSNLANKHSLESAAGVALLLVALIVWMLNWMFRLSVQLQRGPRGRGAGPRVLRPHRPLARRGVTRA